MSDKKQELEIRCKATIAWLDTIDFNRIVDEDREILEFLLSEVQSDPRPEAPMLGAKGCYLNGYKRGYEDAEKALPEMAKEAGWIDPKDCIMPGEFGTPKAKEILHEWVTANHYVQLAEDQTPPENEDRLLTDEEREYGR